jgi:adenosine deaminase
MRDYAEAFAEAALKGLGRTVHAGEGRPAAEIRVAIEALGAERSGHGTTLLDDPDLVGSVVERGVTVEACPTSNVHTGVIARVGDHPLRRWLARGVRVCVNTDNTLLSAVTLPDEVERVRTALGLSPDEVEGLREVGHAARFIRRIAR